MVWFVLIALRQLEFRYHATIRDKLKVGNTTLRRQADGELLDVALGAVGLRAAQLAVISKIDEQSGTGRNRGAHVVEDDAV